MDTDNASEARIIAIGEPVEGADPLFMGTFEAALEEAWRHDRVWLHEIAIWTQDRVYGAEEIEALRREREQA